ncbi:MAG: T9SS type A sorting domain-containing protein [Bacteroidia bacterium]|nr:T9SS type A sorting domain-containing protein [Bacteroidia bacterium]
MMKKNNYCRQLKLALLFIPIAASSQTMPVSLRADVTVQFVMNVNEKCARVAKDPVSGNLFYITSIGNVYEIKNINTSPYDVLLYTSADHGIDFLQGMAFIDSSLFLIGNQLIDSTQNIGMIKKAVLQPNGLRSWVNVATTDPYAQSYTWYDHGFSGIVVSPDSTYLYFSSGSRTDHGEEQNNYNLYPGLREEPLTSAIFRIPANSVNLILPNNAASLSQYLYADGTRNSFDLAFDLNDNLFATENSGDRDDPDELNWIRQGKHYGFPWIAGGNNNPQQFPGYVPANDALLNQSSNSYLNGYYHNDPAFPSSSGITFTPSIKNMGPDADKYRENSGSVNDGSTSGNFVSSFTPHRCALGLEFDRKNILAADLKGSGFAVCFTIGADSSGLDPFGNMGAICDPGQDLLHIELSPDGAGEYQMQVTTIVNNFLNPVDTYLDGNILYIIEYSYMGAGRLFKVTLPLDPVSVEEKNSRTDISVYPNPGSGIFTVNLNKKNTGAKICVYDVLGNCVLSKVCGGDVNQIIDLSCKSKGIYFVQLITDGKRIVKKIVLN